jgi:hypothetical protein
MKSSICRNGVRLFSLRACSTAIAGAADIPQMPTCTLKLQSGWTATGFRRHIFVHCGGLIEATAGSRGKMEVMSADPIMQNFELLKLAFYSSRSAGDLPLPISSG